MNIYFKFIFVIALTHDLFFCTASRFPYFKQARGEARVYTQYMQDFRLPPLCKNEIFALLGCDATLIGLRRLGTNYQAHGSCTTVELGTNRSSQNVSNYQSMLRNIAEERRHLVCVNRNYKKKKLAELLRNKVEMVLVTA